MKKRKTEIDFLEMSHTNFVSSILKTAYQPLFESKNHKNSISTFKRSIFRNVHFPSFLFRIFYFKNINISKYHHSKRQQFKQYFNNISCFAKRSKSERSNLQNSKIQHVEISFLFFSIFNFLDRTLPFRGMLQRRKGTI